MRRGGGGGNNHYFEPPSFAAGVRGRQRLQYFSPFCCCHSFHPDSFLLLGAKPKTHNEVYGCSAKKNMNIYIHYIYSTEIMDLLILLLLDMSFIM